MPLPCAWKSSLRIEWLGKSALALPNVDAAKPVVDEDFREDRTTHGSIALKSVYLESAQDADITLQKLILSIHGAVASQPKPLLLGSEATRLVQDAASNRPPPVSALSHGAYDHESVAAVIAGGRTGVAIRASASSRARVPVDDENEEDGQDDEEGEEEEEEEDDDDEDPSWGSRGRTRTGTRNKRTRIPGPGLRASTRQASGRGEGKRQVHAHAAVAPLDAAGAGIVHAPSVAKGRPMPEQVRRVLLGWFLAHSSHPFPSPVEKRQLMAATGLTAVQIRNWLVNQRKRHWRPTMLGREPRCKFDAALAHMAGLAKAQGGEEKKGEEEGGGRSRAGTRPGTYGGR